MPDFRIPTSICRVKGMKLWKTPEPLDDRGRGTAGDLDHHDRSDSVLVVIFVEPAA